LLDRPHGTGVLMAVLGSWWRHAGTARSIRLAADGGSIGAPNPDRENWTPMLPVPSVPPSLAALPAGLRPCFTAPSFTTFCALVCGMLAQTGRRTVCGMLLEAGLSGIFETICPNLCRLSGLGLRDAVAKFRYFHHGQGRCVLSESTEASLAVKPDVGRFIADPEGTHCTASMGKSGHQLCP